MNILSDHTIMHEPYNVGKLSFEFPNNSLELLREAIKN